MAEQAAVKDEHCIIVDGNEWNVNRSTAELMVAAGYTHLCPECSSEGHAVYHERDGIKPEDISAGLTHAFSVVRGGYGDPEPTDPDARRTKGLRLLRELMSVYEQSRYRSSFEQTQYEKLQEAYTLLSD